MSPGIRGDGKPGGGTKMAYNGGMTMGPEMKKTMATEEQIIRTTMRVLEKLLKKHKGKILGEKGIETGIRTATRLCVNHLRQLGMSNAVIGEHVGVSRDTVASWARGEYTPDPNHFLELIKLYISEDNTYHEGRQTGTEFI